MFHASTVVNNTLYVDGGELRQIAATNSTSYGKVAATLPTTVASIDLARPWNNANHSIWRHIAKPYATLATSPPSLNSGAIFSNGSSLWLYGGSINRLPNASQEVPPNGIWRYDLGSSDWSRAAPSGEPVQRLVKGSNIDASLSRAYYLGGTKDPYSDPAFLSTRDAEPYAVQGLLTFDKFNQSFQNVSTVGMNNAGTMIFGFMTSISSIGSQGVLVAFGGITSDVGASWGGLKENTDSNFLLLQDISVYDIETQRWHQQRASGDIPSGRFDGCAVAATASDGSSHSIYVFGGWGSPVTQRTDGNVYVLSIPSFTWIRVTLDTDPRNGHKCHLMGTHHMLVVGGCLPTGFNGRPDRGVEDCDTGPKFSQGLGIFSLNSHTWTTDYDPGAGANPYQVHASISKVIGGTETGGATKRTPDVGFSSDDLRKLMSSNQQNSNGSVTNTTVSEPPNAQPKPKSSRPLSKGAIAGAVVGVTVGALILGIVLYLICHHRQSHRKESSTIDRSISRPWQPVLFNEIDAAPVGHELRSGTLDDNCAKMWQRQEVSDAAQIYEMATRSRSHELPAHPGSQTAKILPPDTLHPGLADGKKGPGQNTSQQRTAKK
ncbi:MAG: hypothetical protein L6R36_009085 [Xanthoria steineri]|nr:MAG: hypothetical protein L6R36_009085 [Xanthoria steineri]